jgi:hypothetical protein
MIEIIACGDSFIIRRVLKIGVMNFDEDWSIRANWIMKVSDARRFDSETEAEECRTLG